MIPVQLKPEPTNFNSAVRQPGKAFLARTPNPTGKQFNSNAYWKSSAQELYAAYGGICAYSCFYMPTPPGTTDHFLPKVAYPNEAYEWNNYRLSSHRLNNYKADSLDVIDPFIVQPGWFVLDFPSCLVRPGQDISDAVKQQVETTIIRLHLNIDDSLVQERCNIMVDYAKGNINLDFLVKRYPFLALEIARQGLQGNAAQIFKSKQTH